METSSDRRPSATSTTREHYFVEELTFADADSILAMLRELCPHVVDGRLPVWVRNLSYRLVLLQRPDDLYDRSRPSRCRTGEAGKQLHSGYQSAKSDSPGYTDEQHREVARFRAELLDLSTAVATHPFWAPLERGEVVGADRP